jgi:hypothetical protein
MQLENILYAGTQIAHNFGAAAVAGLPIAALWLGPARTTFRKIALLTLFAWLVQGASGAGFGAVSFFAVGELPEIHHLALVALGVKIACAVLAIALLGFKLLGGLEAASEKATLISLAGLGSTALTCAAILRWFS